MRHQLKAALVVALAAPLAACASAFPERGPAPPPPPGYRAVCTTTALPLYFFPTTCTPVQDPKVERRAVVRAKG